MTLSYKLVGDASIEMEVTVRDSSWIGIGFSSGNAVSMVGSGGGSDIVTCSNTGVKRFFVTSYALTGGETVPGATCTQDSGTTTLKFQRSLAARGRRLSQTEIAVTPGAAQQLIYARGDPGQFALTMHPAGRMRGGTRIDFASGDVTASAKRSGEAVLWLHLIFMSVAWAGLLPLGAIIARRFKGRLPGKWIVYHKGLQMAGWLLQIGGLVMAILYVKNFSSHSQGVHAVMGLCVVIVATLQPLNAVIRPHPPNDGEEKAFPRLLWELIHKILGWVMILLALCNIILGIRLLAEKDYDTTTIAVATTLAGVAFAVPLMVLIYSLVPMSGKAAANVTVV